MGLINMTNRAQIHYVRRLNREKFYLSRQVSNLGVNKQYVSHDKMQNFSSVSLKKLCLLDQKKHRDMGCE